MSRLGLGLGSQISAGKLTIYDADALTYINAVQAADGQSLENGVKVAINDFVVGCKADGIWTAIGASCIMAGARTVAGSIVPLKGNAPTNNNFVIGDYSRKTGLLGNGTSKSISTQYLSSTFFQQNNLHLSVYVTSAPTTSSTTKIFIGNSLSVLSRIYLSKGIVDELSGKLSSTSITTIAGEGLTTGFKGGARNGSTSGSLRSSKFNTSVTSTSAAVAANNFISVFAAAAGTVSYSDARMSFYSMGENLDLALLDTRITTLMTTLSSVLP